MNTSGYSSHNPVAYAIKRASTYTGLISDVVWRHILAVTPTKINDTLREHKITGG
jgi:hypothetical protein